MLRSYENDCRMQKSAAAPAVCFAQASAIDTATG
jgi:hypothetical protein